MEDFAKIGRILILAGASHELAKMLKASGKSLFTSVYSSPHIYQIGLRRIGENELAEAFVEPSSSLENIVDRIDNDNSIITAVISDLERGDKESAKKIESLYRQHHYVDGLGYVNPHFVRPRDGIKIYHPRNIKRALKPVANQGFNIKQLISGPFLNQLIEQHGGRERWYHGLCYHYGREEDEARKKDEKLFVYPKHLSCDESIYGIYVNLALGRIKHARKVIDEVIRLYFNESEGIFEERNYHYPNKTAISRTANIVRAMSLANDNGGEELYNKVIDKLWSTYKSKEQKDKLFWHELLSLGFCLEHFGDTERLNLLKQERVQSLESDWLREGLEEEFKGNMYEIMQSEGFKNLYNGQENKFLHHYYFQFENYITAGLLLLGLEKGKPNYFYVP